LTGSAWGWSAGQDVGGFGSRGLHASGGSGAPPRGRPGGVAYGLTLMSFTAVSTQTLLSLARCLSRNGSAVEGGSQASARPGLGASALQGDPEPAAKAGRAAATTWAQPYAQEPSARWNWPRDIHCPNDAVPLSPRRQQRWARSLLQASIAKPLVPRAGGGWERSQSKQEPEPEHEMGGQPLYRFWHGAPLRASCALSASFAPWILASWVRANAWSLTSGEASTPETWRPGAERRGPCRHDGRSADRIGRDEPKGSRGRPHVGARPAADSQIADVVRGKEGRPPAALRCPCRYEQDRAPPPLSSSAFWVAWYGRPGRRQRWQRGARGEFFARLPKVAACVLFAGQPRRSRLSLFPGIRADSGADHSSRRIGT
jgi:hypothetical protein